MNQERPRMLGPALIGGAMAGLLSGLPFLNCLCCLWIIGGAVLAAFLVSRDPHVSLASGDGAVLGALTGVAAAVVDSLVGLPLRGINLTVMRRMMERIAEFSRDMPAGWEDWINRTSGGVSPAMFFLGLFLSAALFAVVGVLGGVLGAALFRKKGPVPAPPAPPSAGDTGGSVAP